MRAESEAVRAVRHAVRSMPAGRWLLAVSGGRDSMALLDACAAAHDDVAAVATFDHGTGAAATRAVEFVEMEAMRRGVPVVTGRGTGAGDETAWRAERWDFLASWAAELGARVVTAHTRDDQAETVFMRILRDAGARGLAGMYARSPVARPFLGLSRQAVAGYAAARKVGWVEDPSNERLTHLRNRVRLEMLPACERARHGFTDWLVDLSRRAAAVRDGIAGVVDELLGPAGAQGAQVDDGTPAVSAPSTRHAQRTGRATVVVPAVTLDGLSDMALGMLWPEIAARGGATLDRRGLERLVAEAPRLRPGGEIPLSNGVTVSRTVSTFVVRNPAGTLPLY